LAKLKNPRVQKFTKALGPGAEVWKQLVDWLAREQDVAREEWK